MEAVKAGFKVPGGTAICEHAFQCLENTTSRASGNKKAALRTQYLATIKSAIQSQEHRYTDLPWEHEELPRAMASENQDTFFHPLVRLAPSWLREVVGTNAKPKWYSPAPLYQNNQDADLALAEHYKEHGGWLSAGDTWLALLLRGPRLLVRHTTLFGRDAMYFVLPEFFGVACVGWPAQKIKIGGAVFYRPQYEALTPDSLKWLVVDEVKNWRSTPFEWVSPAHCASLMKRPRQGGVLAKPSKPEAPILETAAGEAFWEIPWTQITALCKHLGVATAGDDTLFERVKKLIQFCLPRLSMEALHDILAKRIRRPVPLQELVESPEVQELLTKDEEKEFKDTQETEQTKKNREHDFVTAWVASRKKHVKKPVAKAAGKAVGRPASQAYPRRPPEFAADSSEADIQAYMPPHHRIWGDTYNARWQWSYGGTRMMSRSWQLYGYEQSATLLLCEAWKEHVRRGGDPPPWKLEQDPARANQVEASASSH